MLCTAKVSSRALSPTIPLSSCLRVHDGRTDVYDTGQGNSNYNRTGVTTSYFEEEGVAIFADDKVYFSLFDSTLRNAFMGSKKIDALCVINNFNTTGISSIMLYLMICFYELEPVLISFSIINSSPLPDFSFFCCDSTSLSSASLSYYGADFHCSLLVLT